MLKPALNERKCPAQEQLCKAIPACPEGAIAYVADEKAPLGGRIVFDETRCNGCCACADACCGAAIELI
jgi:Pyruvate/2-oxoacid:ferredoxin oxidoreductase delta subunit